MGKRRIPPEKLLLLCEFLNVSPDDVLGKMDPIDVP
jgi:hypothetical protein